MVTWAALAAGSGQWAQCVIKRLPRACRGVEGHSIMLNGRLFALPSSMNKIKKHYLYILRCSDNTLYVGQTQNLKNRLFWHRSGFAAQYTSIRLPVKLVYSEEHPDGTSARHRENQIKRWSGQKNKLSSGVISPSLGTSAKAGTSHPLHCQVGPFTGGREMMLERQAEGIAIAKQKGSIRAVNQLPGKKLPRSWNF